MRGLRSRFASIGAAGVLWIAAACTDAPTALDAGTAMELVLEGVRPLDPQEEGTLALWITTAAGDTIAAGRLDLSGAGEPGTVRLPFTLPADDPLGVVVTLEPPGDDDDRPSAFPLLAGDFHDGAATLGIEGALTTGRPLEEAPGAHSLFTTSNNVEEGYPSDENAGIWLFSLIPSRNRHGTREVHVTPLRPGWIYEGWIVYRYGTPEEFWISYGKYRPDVHGLLTSRDNTGSGVFSGDVDYVNGGVEDVPGEEWTTDRLGYEMPGGFALPLAVDAVDPATGDAVWTHVITIEPGFDEFEPLLTERPFLVRPYRNPIGAGGPGVPRVIEYVGLVPSGQARPVR
ncbi:MAG TPA: hypothetical protein VF212_12595 [Longimicrobiales bacterium]